MVTLKPVLNWANVCSPNKVRTVWRTLLHSQLACNEMQALAWTCGRRAADSMIENIGKNQVRSSQYTLIIPHRVIQLTIISFWVPRQGCASHKSTNKQIPCIFFFFFGLLSLLYPLVSLPDLGSHFAFLFSSAFVYIPMLCHWSSWLVICFIRSVTLWTPLKKERERERAQKTSTEVQNLHCDIDLEYSKATFSQDTPAYEHALSN